MLLKPSVWNVSLQPPYTVASVFLNKAIFEVWKYRFPASLVAGQTVGMRNRLL